MNADEFRSRLAEMGVTTMSGFARIMIELGDPRDFKAIEKTLARASRGESAVSGEMHVIVTMLERLGMRRGLLPVVLEPPRSAHVYRIDPEKRVIECLGSVASIPEGMQWRVVTVHYADYQGPAIMLQGNEETSIENLQPVQQGGIPPAPTPSLSGN